MVLLCAGLDVVRELLLASPQTCSGELASTLVETMSDPAVQDDLAVQSAACRMLGSVAATTPCVADVQRARAHVLRCCWRCASPSVAMWELLGAYVQLTVRLYAVDQR